MFGVQIADQDENIVNLGYVEDIEFVCVCILGLRKPEQSFQLTLYFTRIIRVSIDWKFKIEAPHKELWKKNSSWIWWNDISLRF